jgi:hypothetical protein
LGFGFLVDLGAEGGELGFGVGGEDVGEVADVADGPVGDLEGLLGAGGEWESERDNQNEESGACGAGAVRGDCEVGGHRDVGLAYPDLMIWRCGRYLIAWGGGILLRGVGGGFCAGEAGDVELRDHGCAVLGAGGGVGGGVGVVGDDSVTITLGESPVGSWLADITPGSPPLREPTRSHRSEREQKAWARFGRDDRSGQGGSWDSEGTGAQR